MSYTQVGSCPKCGAPVYCESPWWGTVPPPSTYTCACYGTGAQQVTTTGVFIDPEVEKTLGIDIDPYVLRLEDVVNDVAECDECCPHCRKKARRALGRQA